MKQKPLPPQVWNDWQNAEIYQEFIDEYGIYRELNRRLVEVAEIRDALRVLDLGCGTGATTAACLEALGPQAEILGVDAASAMVEVARARIDDPRAQFVVARTAAHLPPEIRMKALASAREMTDPNREVRVPWEFFVARRRLDQA
jgi:trans-aconitate methyltransferase